jgi:aminomethyltransferase
MKKTPLSSLHESLGARMVDFSGWWMPLQYKGILQEHEAVRTAVGIFDISHMGEFFVEGDKAATWLDFMLTNSVASLAEGTGQYSLMLNERGGVIDDLILYRSGPKSFLMVVNASMIDQDAAWMLAHLPATNGIQFEDRSDAHAAVAIQGPEAPRIYEILIGSIMPAKNTFRAVRAAGVDALAAITGYTGEAGFELFFAPTNAERIWCAAMDAGATPCGLGARDSLRLEMGYPLNGFDLSPERTPLEAGLDLFVCLEKDDFIGRDALIAQKAQGIPTKLCCLQAEGKAPPLRPHYPVLHNGLRVAETTSGVLSPSTGSGIAMAYLPAELAVPGTEVSIEIRGRFYPARVVKKPFYKKTKLS